MIVASHDETIIKNFCHAAIWLHEGQARWFDSPAEALAEYRKSLPS